MAATENSASYVISAMESQCVQLYLLAGEACDSVDDSLRLSLQSTRQLTFGPASMS